MGIIAGVKALGGCSDNLQIVLSQMIGIQRHRDQRGDLQSISTEKLAVGMVNYHNTIFCSTRTSQLNDINNVKGPISAFVDGIVLNTIDIKNLLTEFDYLLDYPTCSSAVIAAYNKWGYDFINYLEGEFACVIWDERFNRLIIARDRYGHKPLHYYAKGDKLYFSSEIKGLLAVGIPREIDNLNVSDFFSLNCIPYPATIFKDIFQVAPGEMLISDDGGIQLKKYWSPSIDVGDSKDSFVESVYKLETALKKAVNIRMLTSDVYCFLSGGIDSSAIVSFASEVSGRKICAINVGFEEEDADEYEDAKIMAKHAGVELHHVVASPDSFFNMLETLVGHHDIPFTDTSAYPTYFAAKLGRQFSDIILTGDGPDQSLGGSAHHVFAVKNNSFSRRSESLRLMAKFASLFIGLVNETPEPSFFSRVQRKLYRNSLSPVQAAYDLRSYFPEIVKHYMCSPDLWEIHTQYNPYRHPVKWFMEAEGNDDINKYLYADMKFYVPDDLMIKIDRMCMAHDLETLSPFQDSKVADIVNKLPGSFKISKSENGDIKTKFILRKVCENRFPEHTLTKKKQGFGIPLDKWMKQNNGEKIKEILFDNRALTRGFFREKSIIKMVNSFLNNKGDYFFPSSNAIAGLLVFEIWLRKYID